MNRYFLTLFLGLFCAISAAAQTYTVAPLTIARTATQGDPAFEDTLTLTATTPTVITFASDQSWCSIEPTSLFLDGVDPGDVTVTTDPTGLAPSATPYEAIIYVLAPGNTLADAEQVVVTLTINPKTENVSDFNGDGRSDVIFQNGAQLEIWNLNSNLVTATATPTPGTAPSGFQLVSTGDFNGDGFADFLFQKADGSLRVRLMNGANQIVELPVASSPTSSDWKVKACCDLNFDTISDIIFQHSDGRFEVWYMSGNLRIGVTSLSDDLTTSPGWELVGCGDFNGDLLNDVLFQSASGELAVWYLDGVNKQGNTQVLSANVTADPAWSVVAVHDADNDGEVDIIFQHPDGRIRLWTMTGITRSGSVAFGSQRLGDPNWTIRNTGNRFPWAAIQLSTTLVNFGTIVSTATETETVTVSNPGSRALTISAVSAAYPFSVNWTSATIAAGGSKALIITFDPDAVGSWNGVINIAGSDFASGRIDLVGNAVQSIGLLNPPQYDFNRDGSSDFLWRNPNTGGSWIQYTVNGDAVGGKALSTIVGRPWNQHAADFNGDGNPDILWRNPVTGTMWVQYMVNGSPIGGKALTISIANPWELDLADFNNDGQPDILWRNPSSGVAFVQYLNDDLVAIGGKVLASSVGSPWNLHLADLNRDSHPDIVWRNPVTGVAWVQYLQNGDIIGGKALSVAVGQPWEALVLDQDRDSHADILWRNPITAVIWIQYLVDGNPVGGKASAVSVGAPWELLGAE